jgi:hypothetical protein
MIPTPWTEAAAGIMEAGAGGLTAAGEAANEYVGAGYTLDVEFKDGKPVAVYHGQDIIDLQEFAERALKKLQDRPERERDLSTALGLNASVAHEFAPYFKTTDEARSFLKETAEYLNASVRYTHVPLTETDVVEWFNGKLPGGLPPDRLHLFVQRNVGTLTRGANGHYSTVLSSERYDARVVAETIADMAQAAAAHGWAMPKPAPATGGTGLSPPVVVPPAREQWAVKLKQGEVLRARPDPGSSRLAALPTGSFVTSPPQQPLQSDSSGRQWREVDVVARRKHGYLPAGGTARHPIGTQDSHWGRFNPELEGQVSSGLLVRVTVLPGDTFSEILQRNGLQDRTGEIEQLNGQFLHIDDLRAGDVIYLPKKDPGP